MRTCGRWRGGGDVFVAQSSQLAGLRGFCRGLALDLNTELTVRADGVPDEADGDWFNEADTPDSGSNQSCGLTNDLDLNITVRRDFCRVEADVTQFGSDPWQALFLPEKPAIAE